MRKLYLKLIVGFISALLIYGIFFACQYSFSQDLVKKQNSISESINNQNLLQHNNEAFISLKEKVDVMIKYVDASQKNLDLWLKLLTFILSILIGYSIFSGLKTRELAKEELSEIRRIRFDINREAINAEDRLKIVKDQIIQIEGTATNAQKIEQEMTKKLNEFASKEDIVLNETQIKILDDTIDRTKEELQKSGIEAFKNLYYAKALISYNKKDWDDSIRLFNNYLDLDENNEEAFFKRGRAYLQLYRLNSKNISFANKALSDYDKVIVMNPNRSTAYNNRGNVFLTMNDLENALKDYTQAISLNPNYAMAFNNRSIVYDKLKDYANSKDDLLKSKELDPERYG